MTREEALKLSRYDETPYYFQELIRKIYDDMESRTCENCKWFHDIVDGEYGYGDEWISCNNAYMELNDFDKTIDFCSRFERKKLED